MSFPAIPILHRAHSLATSTFQPSQDIQMHLKPDDIAQALEDILNMGEGISRTELTIRPKYFGISKK